MGSAGEWKQVFSLWPAGYRLVAIEAYREGTGPGVPGRRSLDDYADQVYGVAEHVGACVCLVGFSWGGATVDHAICDLVRRQVPRAQHTVIEGAGHMMPLTHPEPLTRALLSGIRRWARSSATGNSQGRQS